MAKSCRRFVMGVFLREVYREVALVDEDGRCASWPRLCGQKDQMEVRCLGFGYPSVVAVAVECVVSVVALPVAELAEQDGWQHFLLSEIGVVAAPVVIGSISRTYSILTAAELVLQQRFLLEKLVERLAEY